MSYFPFQPVANFETRLCMSDNTHCVVGTLFQHNRQILMLAVLNFKMNGLLEFNQQTKRIFHICTDKQYPDHNHT